MAHLLNKIVKIGNSLGKVVAILGDTGEVRIMDIDTCDLNKMFIKLQDLEEVPEGKESSVEAFYEQLANNYFYDDTIQEIKFLKESGGADKLASLTLAEAAQKKTFLYDLNDFDLDTFFSKIIKDYRL